MLNNFIFFKVKFSKSTRRWCVCVEAGGGGGHNVFSSISIGRETHRPICFYFIFWMKNSPNEPMLSAALLSSGYHLQFVWFFLFKWKFLQKKVPIWTPLPSAAYTGEWRDISLMYARYTSPSIYPCTGLVFQANLEFEFNFLHLVIKMFQFWPKFFNKT